jgi:hypothetical protein
MCKRVLAGLLGAAVLGTSLFPPLGTVPSAMANKPIYICVVSGSEPPDVQLFQSAADARAYEKANDDVECSAGHDH